MKNYKNESKLINDISKNTDTESIKAVKSYRNMEITSSIILAISLAIFSMLMYIEMNSIVITETFTLMLYTFMCIFILVGSIISNRVFGKNFFNYIKKNNIHMDNLL